MHPEQAKMLDELSAMIELVKNGKYDIASIDEKRAFYNANEHYASTTPGPAKIKLWREIKFAIKER